MKKSIFTVSAFVGLIAVATSFSSRDLIEVPSGVCSEMHNKQTKSQTFKIRYGLLAKDGTKMLSGTHDLDGFTAENTCTGEIYYSDGSVLLPQYSEEIPAGVYSFSGRQGQGHWVGYGTIIATVSEANVDADGYITVYIPIIWEE